LVLNVLWLLLDVTNVENLDLIKKLIFVQIVAIELQGLQSHLSENKNRSGLWYLLPIVFWYYWWDNRMVCNKRR